MIFNGALPFSALASHGTRFVRMVFKHETFYRSQDYVEMVIFESSILLSNDHVSGYYHLCNASAGDLGWPC